MVCAAFLLLFCSFLCLLVFFCLDGPGYLFVEARSVRDSLYGLNATPGPDKDSWLYDGGHHYRRFLRADEFADEVAKDGFEVLLIEEVEHVSAVTTQTRTDDPVVIRCIARFSKEGQDTEQNLRNRLFTPQQPA